MKLFHLTATEAIKKIRDKEISIRELNDSFIERIESLEGRIHAWAYFNKELVYPQIDRIEKEIADNTFDGMLFGVPLGVKDIFNAEDMPASMGSPVYEGFTPGNDARVVHKAKLEGGVVMGKTVTAEFAVHHPGPTNNPHNPEYFPGTSSSGSAAAVASAMVPLALGTQTAGSIIRPASYCGVYGYKPSFGLLPRIGILKTVDPLDHVGFFSRSVDDLKLLLDALRVKGHNYPFVYKYMDNPRTKRKRDENASWRVAFIKTHLWDMADDYVKKSISNFTDKISTINGIKVEEVELPAAFKEAHNIHNILYNKALSYYFKEECEKYPDLISSDFMELVNEGRKTGKEEYLACLDKQNELALKLDNYLKKYDVALSFSTAGEAMKKEKYREEKPDTSLIWTMCRIPSINLPLFKGPKGLPFGVQAIARRFNDYDLLSFLSYLEKHGMLDKSEIACSDLKINDRQAAGAKK